MADTETIKNRAEIYSKEKTYTCVTNKDNFFFHGFIIEIKELYLIIKDRIRGNFPILYSDILWIAPSKQKPSKEEIEERI